MIREFTITLTSKGQLTLPAPVRKALGVNAKGDKLRLRLDEEAGRADIQPPVSFEQIQALASTFIRSDITPLENPRELFEQREVKR